MIALVFYRIEWTQILPRIQLYLGTPKSGFTDTSVVLPYKLA